MFPFIGGNELNASTYTISQKRTSFQCITNSKYSEHILFNTNWYFAHFTQFKVFSPFPPNIVKVN